MTTLHLTRDKTCRNSWLNFSANRIMKCIACPVKKKAGEKSSEALEYADRLPGLFEGVLGLFIQ